MRAAAVRLVDAVATKNMATLPYRRNTRARPESKARSIPRPSAAGRAARRPRPRHRASPRSAPRRKSRSACRRRARRAISISASGCERAFGEPAPARLGRRVCRARAPWPKAKLRDCGDEQVSTRSPSPESPIKVDRARAESFAETAQLGEAARDQGGDRACAEAVTGRDAAGDGEHVLRRAADLDAAHVGRMVERSVGPLQRVAERARRGSRRRAASVTAVGRPAATSAAKEGPERMAVGRPGAASARTSVMKSMGRRARCPWRRPRAAAEPGTAASRVAISRVDWAGVATRIASHRARSAEVGGRRDRAAPARRPGSRSLRRVALQARKRASSRPHSATSRPAAAAALASAMPQAPRRRRRFETPAVRAPHLSTPANVAMTQPAAATTARRAAGRLLAKTLAPRLGMAGVAGAPLCPAART